MSKYATLLVWTIFLRDPGPNSGLFSCSSFTPVYCGSSWYCTARCPDWAVSRGCGGTYRGEDWWAVICHLWQRDRAYYWYSGAQPGPGERCQRLNYWIDSWECAACAWSSGMRRWF